MGRKRIAKKYFQTVETNDWVTGAYKKMGLCYIEKRETF
jgi:hypothetical protein